MNLKKLPNGMLEGYVILRKCEVKTARNGSEYLDLIIADKDGELPSKLWDYTGGNAFKADTVVKVRGTIEQYNGNDQFKISQIWPATNSDNYNIADLVPSSKTSGEEIFSMLMSRVNGFKDSDLKAIVTAIMLEKKDALVKCPAAYRLHHAIVGGLMLHTTSIVRMAEEVCKIYTNVDRDLLLSGAILHDVAKTWEYEFANTGLATGYSTGGELVGHLVKGAMYVEEKAKQLNIKNEKVLLLEHMILSHHGDPEYGAAVKPMFLEAEILAQLDTLDATIYEINDATSKVEKGEFTPRQWALDDRKLYNHGLKSTEHDVNLKG